MSGMEHRSLSDVAEHVDKLGVLAQVENGLEVVIKHDMIMRADESSLEIVDAGDE